LTQRELAARLGLHPNSVARMERDEMRITRAMALAVQAVTRPATTKRGGRR
jgi:plasmid maintenance system antidote protein VapI